MYYQDHHVTLYNKDCRAMDELPDNSVHCIVTRLPLDVNAILERRVHYHPDGISGYLREWLTFELKRDHHRGKGKRARQRAN